MNQVNQAHSEVPISHGRLRWRRVRGVLVLAMGCLAVAAPFLTGTLALFLVGWLLIAAGVLEMLETFNVRDEAGRFSAYLGGALSVLAGLLLLTQPQLLLRGLSLLVAGAFFVDGINKTVESLRARKAGTSWKWTLARGLINVALALVLAFRWPVSGRAMVMILVGIRLLAAGWSMLTSRVALPGPAAAAPAVGCHPDRRLGLPSHPEFAAFEKSFPAEEANQRLTNAVWCWTFVFVFFGIHIGRMHIEWNPTGMIAPLGAVIGDVGTALIIAFGIILPCRLAWRRLTRPLERRGWKRSLARSDQGKGPGLVGRISRVWLMARMRFSWRMARARRSPRAALDWGLQVGLPATAILIAVNPIWGFSWFFNSESWTAGIWDRWAEARTDIWRAKMVEAIQEHYRGRNLADDRLFAVEPEGVAGAADFSFLVLGDTGEGGSAQHSLRDRYLFLGQRPDVKFLVISSDVIYPEGAMLDYEPNFYLPFKGFTKPIYAIPGNHDWYDALEGFAANFLEPDAARVCMQARMTADGWWTTTRPRDIEAKIEEAARWRREYGVRTGWQRGPFFEVQTEKFALIAVDTGVIRRVDTDQWAWLKAALQRSKGKFVIAILGHPFYAGGRYQAGGDEPFAGEWLAQEHTPEIAGYRMGPDTAPFAVLHRLLREYRVPVVMAGDTHYFEHYVETYEDSGAADTMYHFVNGGGGAYMSIGTPLDWPARPAVPDCAFYPRKDFVIAKLDRETPAWKKPLWWWAKDLHGWPLTAEALAGAFTYSRSPYLQSFVEIRVENSRGRLRLIPHSTSGPLRWRELETFGALVPIGKTGEDLAEFVFSMPGVQP
jgi:uncharacterized membrane protein HdeD (DUF308 family)